MFVVNASERGKHMILNMNTFGCGFPAAERGQGCSSWVPGGASLWLSLGKHKASSLPEDKGRGCCRGFIPIRSS